MTPKAICAARMVVSTSSISATACAPSRAWRSYQYDAAGRRTVTSDGSGDRLRSFYGQGGQLLYEQRRDGGATEFIMLGSRLLAKRQGGVVTYQHVDSLGSPVATSNAAGQVIERTQYEPYGQSIGKAIDGVGYTGHVSDAVSGLVYMQQRYYDPQIGRFLSVDPVTAYSSPVGAFSRYRYADNSPYNFIDPDGRQAFGHQRSEDIPWWDVTGRVGNWFAETRDLSAQVGFTGDSVAQDALVEQYRAAGDAIVAVQMAALPEFSAPHGLKQWSLSMRQLALIRSPRNSLSGQLPPGVLLFKQTSSIPSRLRWTRMLPDLDK